MAAKVKLEEGQSFVLGRSSAKARDLIGRLGDGEGQIITTAFGYIVPSSILRDGEGESDEHANVLPDGTDAAKAERGEESEEAAEDESEEPKTKSRSRKAADTEEGK